MTDIRFYHLTRSPMGQALPELLEKTLSRGWRAVVQLQDEGQVEPLAAQLWSYRPESFLPHGTAKDGQAQDQPVWLTAKAENPNKAEVLFLIDGAAGENLEDYSLVCEVFDGGDTAIVDGQRRRWVDYKKAEHTLAYWQQTEKGWTKKAD